MSYLGSSAESWAIGFFLMFVALTVYFLADLGQIKRVRKLHKYGSLVTKKGKYTFEPHKGNDSK